MACKQLIEASPFPSAHLEDFVYGEVLFTVHITQWDLSATYKLRGNKTFVLANVAHITRSSIANAMSASILEELFYNEEYDVYYADRCVFLHLEEDFYLYWTCPSVYTAHADDAYVMVYPYFSNWFSTNVYNIVTRALSSTLTKTHCNQVYAFPLQTKFLEAKDRIQCIKDIAMEASLDNGSLTNIVCNFVIAMFYEFEKKDALKATRPWDNDDPVRIGQGLLISAIKWVTLNSKASTKVTYPYVAELVELVSDLFKLTHGDSSMELFRLDSIPEAKTVDTQSSLTAFKKYTVGIGYWISQVTDLDVVAFEEASHKKMGRILDCVNKGLTHLLKSIATLKQANKPLSKKVVQKYLNELDLLLFVAFGYHPPEPYTDSVGSCARQSHTLGKQDPLMRIEGRHRTYICETRIGRYAEVRDLISGEILWCIRSIKKLTPKVDFPVVKIESVGDLHFFAPGCSPLWPLYVVELVNGAPDSDFCQRIEALDESHEYIYVTDLDKGTIVDLGTSGRDPQDYSKVFQLDGFNSLNGLNTEQLGRHKGFLRTQNDANDFVQYTGTS